MNVQQSYNIRTVTPGDWRQEPEKTKIIFASLFCRMMLYYTKYRK